MVRITPSVEFNHYGFFHLITDVGLGFVPPSIRFSETKYQYKFERI